jgi:molybdenum cofactor cytidylyltransferase
VAVAAILLAAGESTRMGSPKPLLPWGDETLVEYDIRQLREAGADDVVVVVGHATEGITSLAKAAGARVMFNASYRTGRATSLAAGAHAIRSADLIVVANVDQPRPAAIIRSLLAEHEGPITVPTHNGQRGHPVVVEGALLTELRAVNDATQGLRAVVERHHVHEVSFHSPLVLLDLNTREDYEGAVKTYFAEAQQ